MKSHRGLSAVVGTVFLVAIVIGALTYVSYSLEIMGNFSEQLIAEESRQRDIQDEKFSLTFVDVTPSDKLDATIKNTGDIPVKITTLYLDEMGANDVVQKHSIDKTISPGTSFNFLTEGIDVDVDSTKGYSMKLVSSRGETQTFYLNSASQESVDLRLIASPKSIPTGFSTTLMMVVVNNMSNNNPLVNLTPVEPTCTGICSKLSGPIPASYDMLAPGDVAIFRWVFELNGDEDDSVTFTGQLQNGFPGNTDSETVTIKSVELADVAGQSITSLGFGGTTLADDLFILHMETYGIPSNADYQMTTTVPDTSGTTIILNDVNDKSQWFSANVTTYETTISAGVWNASLRYNNDRLPSGMAAGASDIHDNDNDGGGHTLHFNTSPTLARKDSGQMSSCTSLVDSGTLSGATWGANIGVNGSGAYFFDGDNDYISIINSGSKKDCNYADNQEISIAGWFNSTAIDTSDRQTIFSKSGNEGGYNVWVGNSGSDGWVGFQFYDEDADSVNCWAENDYTDKQWHHFVGIKNTDTTCQLYVDGVLEDSSTNNSLDHEHENDETIYIGAKDGNQQEFTGVIDDILYWNNYVLTADDVTALYQHSFGENSTRLNFFLNNATDVGDTVDVLAADLSYGLPWVDQMDHTDKDDLWAGGNWTIALPQVNLHLDPANRLNFTISYASGAPLNLRVDDEDLDGTSSNLISSYIQVPGVDPELPVFHMHDRDNKVTFFAYNGIGEGVWLTYQGSRIVFNGTNGHYTGIIDTVDIGNGKKTVDADTDSPFIDEDVEASVVFWHPQYIPTASQPGEPEKIPEGNYDVNVYLNGYDEDGTVFIRSIVIGTVRVTS